jgi:hypothetical protein
MKKQHLIWIAAGVIIFGLLIKSKVRILGPDIIKPGDKSNDVYGLQSVLASVTGLQFNNAGAYDAETLKAVQYYMKDTNALVDYEKGYVNKNFASDLFLVQDKVKK